MLKNSHVPGAISFSFASHWLQNRLLTVINLKTALHEWVQSCTPTGTIETATHLVSLGSSYVMLNIPVTRTEALQMTLQFAERLI